MIIGEPKRWGVIGAAFPDADKVEHFGLADHAHAIIAEDVATLTQAKKLGEAWAKKFRKGLVLAPCACEDMVDAGAPSATRHATGPVRALLPASGGSPAPSFKQTRIVATLASDAVGPSPSDARREDCAVCKAIPGRCVQHDVIEKQVLCPRCYRTVPGRFGKAKAHACSHGQPCRPAHGQPDRPACSYCDDEAVDACGFMPTGPDP